MRGKNHITYDLRELYWKTKPILLVSKRERMNLKMNGTGGDWRVNEFWDKFNFKSQMKWLQSKSKNDKNHEKRRD